MCAMPCLQKVLVKRDGPNNDFTEHYCEGIIHHEQIDSVVVLFLIVVLACDLQGQNYIERAQAEMDAYLVRDVDELGDYYLKTRCIWSASPENDLFFESTWVKEYFEHAESKRKVFKIDKRFVDDGYQAEQERADPPNATRVIRHRSKFQYDCGYIVIFKGDYLYIHDSEWEKYANFVSWKRVEGDEAKVRFDRIRANCTDLANPFDWPFLTLLDVLWLPRRANFDNSKCICAKVTDEGLESVWTRKSGDIFSYRYITFQDGLPVRRVIRASHDPIKTDEDFQKANVISDVMTTWKLIESHNLPVHVRGIINEAYGEFHFDTTFEWKIGKQIPEELIQNYLKIVKEVDEAEAKGKKEAEDKPIR